MNTISALPPTGLRLVSCTNEPSQQATLVLQKLYHAWAPEERIAPPVPTTPSHILPLC